MARSIQRIQITPTGMILAYDDGTGEQRDFVVAPPPAPPPPPPPSGIVKGGYFDYVPYDRTLSLANEFGMSWARTWFTVNWDRLPTAADFNHNRALRQQGVNVLTVFTPPEKRDARPAGAAPATAQIAKDWFKAALDAGGDVTDAWEIYNEPNLRQYNSGPIMDTLTKVMIPAWEVLHPAHRLVLSSSWNGSATYSSSLSKYLIPAGYLQACDIVAYHPYGNTATVHIQNVQGMRGLIGEKPLWLTEWNIHAGSWGASPEDWMTHLHVAATGVKDLVQGIIHFRIIKSASPSGLYAGAAAPYQTIPGSIERRPVYYEGTKAAMEVF